jgi:hypothetical protein
MQRPPELPSDAASGRVWWGHPLRHRLVPKPKLANLASQISHTPCPPVSNTFLPSTHSNSDTLNALPSHTLPTDLHLTAAPTLLQAVIYSKPCLLPRFASPPPPVAELMRVSELQTQLNSPQSQTLIALLHLQM